MTFETSMINWGLVQYFHNHGLVSFSVVIDKRAATLAIHSHELLCLVSVFARIKDCGRVAAGKSVAVAILRSNLLTPPLR